MKTLLLIVTAALFLAGCAALDPLASFRPLFPRLDESGLSTQARAALAEAKHDFQETREQRPPRHARLARADAAAGLRLYEGRGYTLTVFDGNGPRHRVGQRIEVDASITGGEVIRYDESYEQWD